MKKLEIIYQTLQEMKARNLVAYDISDAGVSNFLVIATFVNTNECKKNAEKFAALIKYESKIDGFHKGEWIIFDLGEIVVQMFASGFRERYNIDKLYKGRQVVFSKKAKK